MIEIFFSFQFKILERGGSDSKEERRNACWAIEYLGEQDSELEECGNADAERDENVSSGIAQPNHSLPTHRLQYSERRSSSKRDLACLSLIRPDVTGRTSGLGSSR